MSLMPAGPGEGPGGGVIPIRESGSGVRLKAAEPYNIVGAETIFAPLPAVNWLCQTLRIAPGAPTLFAGYGYSGKSVALQSLALSVASGSALWGSRVCKRGRVLHLDYEQGLRITAGRYQRLAHAEAIDARALIGWLECGVLPSAPLNADALSWMGDNRTAVVVDSWRGSHPSVDENSSEVRKTLDAMGIASEKTGCTFATLHHARKPQKDSGGGSKMSIRGSSGFFDGCQTVYLFDGEEVGAPVVTLEKDRIQGSSVEPFVLRIEDTDGGQGLCVRAEAIQEPAEASPREKYDALMREVKNALEGNPGASASELTILLEKRKAAVLAAVQSLMSAGDVVQRGTGNAAKLYLKSSIANDEAPF